MKLPQRIYEVIRKEYPTESDIQISEMMGLSVTTMSRLRRGIGIGVPVA